VVFISVLLAAAELLFFVPGGKASCGDQLFCFSAHGDTM
jgi:hypothetical protein